jgi:peptide/nickel transport system substrate-binding protein
MIKRLSLVAVLVAASISCAVLAQGARTDLVIAVPDEPPSLDPTTNASAAIDQILQENVYEGLVRAAPDGELEPGLAAAFEVSADGLTYTFSLRQGVLFHDGRPFTAADVVSTFERDKNPETGHPNPSYYSQIDRIEAPAPATVVFRMKNVDASFLSLLALGDSVILPAPVPEDLARRPVGTGPFRFLEWRTGDLLRLERFPGYYRPGIPQLERVTFRFVSDPASALASLLAGDVDLIARIPAETALSVKDDPRFKTVAGPQNLVQLLAMNKARTPFSKLQVRQAIACALDRAAIIEGTMFGYGIPIGSHLTPSSPYYVDLTGLYPYNVDEARRLLADAGYPDGFSATLTLPQNYEIHVRTGEIIADLLERVGIHLKIELVEWGQWLSRVFNQADYDLTVMGHVGKLDPGAMLSNYGADSLNYYYRRSYDDPILDGLLAEGRRTVDVERRKTIYAQAQEIIARDVVNYFIQDPYQIFVMKAGIAGFNLYPIYSIQVADVYWSS